ncbi:MAG TPA: hypothetical protein VE995_07570 [Gaiellaceae bacterium]|nr:hypothetical protein [Gaiellaceae bacterium]
MSDESQREEMNAAIRAQRERRAVPRSMLPPEDAGAPAPAEPPAPPSPEAEAAQPPRPPRRGLLSRLWRR